MAASLSAAHGSAILAQQTNLPLSQTDWRRVPTFALSFCMKHESGSTSWHCGHCPISTQHSVSCTFRRRQPTAGAAVSDLLVCSAFQPVTHLSGVSVLLWRSPIIPRLYAAHMLMLDGHKGRIGVAMAGFTYGTSSSVIARRTRKAP